MCLCNFFITFSRTGKPKLRWTLTKMFDKRRPTRCHTSTTLQPQNLFPIQTSKAFFYLINGRQIWVNSEKLRHNVTYSNIRQKRPISRNRRQTKNLSGRFPKMPTNFQKDRKLHRIHPSLQNSWAKSDRQDLKFGKF